MKFIIKKVGHDSVSVNVDGFQSEIVSFDEFFADTICLSNKYCYVDSYSYDNGVITFNKLDKRFDKVYYDRYFISPELLDDERFMQKLGEFIETYEAKRPELNAIATNKMDDYWYATRVMDVAKDIYVTYRENGVIKPIYWDEIRTRVIDLYLNHKKEVASHDHSMLDYRGDTDGYDYYEDTASTVGKCIGALSLLISGSTMIVAIGMASREVIVPNDITGLMLTTATIGAFALAAAKQHNVKTSRTALNELALKLQNDQNIEELTNGPIIPEERLTLTP